MKGVYSMAINHFIIQHKTELIVDLFYPKLHSESDLSEFDIDDILLKSETALRRFLISKSLLKELPEITSSGCSNHLV